MQIRSKKLYAYLLASGVLDGTPEDIDRAKRTYRKQYKKQWKQNKRPRKELRIELTLKQFHNVKTKARQYDLAHTTYARQILLASVESGGYFIPYQEKLQKILQVVSMAVIASYKATTIQELSNRLLQVETELLNYLQYIT